MTVSSWAIARMAAGNCTAGRAGKRAGWVSERPFFSFDVHKLKPDTRPKEQLSNGLQLQSIRRTPAAAVG